MAVSRSTLGLNARNYLFMRPLNKGAAKNRADDKLSTKRRLIKHKVPTPQLIASLTSFSKVRSFDWGSLPKRFVLKPARGYGGEGIVVVRGWDGKEGKTASGSINIAGLEAVIFSILDGAYSLKNLPDIAFIEERVTVSGTLRKLSKKGVPDIRVIVCNKVPIMAMLRLPTPFSQGKANLHQGAIGLGIDIRTGITTQAVFRGEMVRHFPGTKDKVRGIKIPQWDAILRIAVESQEAIGLGYAGIDIVLDEARGPLVLEVNARPGLQIQLANGESLRTRLERVADMRVPSIEFGIDLSKKLFAEHALADVADGNQILAVLEKVTIYGGTGKKIVQAKVDTGAFRTSIDAGLAKELGLPLAEEKVKVRSSLGRQERPTVSLRIKLRNKDIQTVATIANREHMAYQMIIGRRDLKGFLVNPAQFFS